MGDCQHPRSQEYVDGKDRCRCGACGDVWVPHVARSEFTGHWYGMWTYLNPEIDDFAVFPRPDAPLAHGTYRCECSWEEGIPEKGVPCPLCNLYVAGYEP